MFPPSELSDASGTRAPEPPFGSSAASLVHDFNNLLTSILGHVSMLQTEPSLSSEGHHGLAQIRRAAHRATDLTRQLRAFSQCRASAPLLSQPKVAWTPAEVMGNETILLVEDDDDVRELARRALAQQGYTVLAAADADAAMALANRHPGHIHLFLADVVLPQLNGRELVARLSIHRPATKVLYVSGTNDDVITRHRVLEPGTEFLEKPFSLDHLLRAVRYVLGPPEPARQ